ncbi:MAG: type II secretion system F family protein [Acidimicrobiales bacterium]
MTGLVLLAAAASASFVMLAVSSVVAPRRRLAPRLEAYSAYGRSRLGTGAGAPAVRRLVIDDDRSALCSVFGPTVAEAAARLSKLVDAADADELAQRLRQSGKDDPDVAQYRIRQLATAVAGCAVGAVSGAAIFGVGSGSLAMFVCFAVAGLSMHRGSLDRAISERSARMRTEVPVIAQLLAVHLRTGHGPVESLRAVVRRSIGPVADDCRAALGLIAGGTSPQAAFERLADESAEPTATRLYRLLASSIRVGGDIVDPLLAVASEVRAQQREELARRSVKRRTAMVVPLLVLVAPVMTLFVGAALPSLVFGNP